jgi:D-alanyl-D-alanine dipeptidase
MNAKNLKIAVQRVVLIATLAVSLFFTACNSEKNPNPYGLDLITTTEEYLTSIEVDSANFLIDLEDHIPGILLDIRYAGTDNFTETKIYSAPKAYLRKEAADSLLKLQEELKKEGLGIKVFDAYRPYSATLYFYEVYPDTTFVAAPWKGSIHNRGCAIDLTIVNLVTGEELVMPTPFDEFSERASYDYIPEDSLILANRNKLLNVMERFGFEKYDYEWWHYNFSNRKGMGLLNISFEDLEKLKEE